MLADFLGYKGDIEERTQINIEQFESYFEIMYRRLVKGMCGIEFHIYKIYKVSIFEVHLVKSENNDSHCPYFSHVTLAQTCCLNLRLILNPLSLLFKIA